MRKDLCPNCKGPGGEFYCQYHQNQSAWCDCRCPKCEGYGKLCVKISDDELDNLTLKVSQVLYESGVLEAKYNESNNVLRHSIKDFLVKWCDYDIDRHSDWRHVDWIELRRKFGMSDPFAKVEK